MEATPNPQIRCVLILKADRIYAEALRQYTLHVFPGARVLVAWSVAAARTILAAEPVDFFVTGAGATLESDVLDLLAQRASKPLRVQHVLVVTVRREYRVLAALRGLAIDGVFDSASELPGAFVTALRDMHRIGSSSTALFRLLTVFEQVVLAVIGDGCDNTVAARALKLSPATVSTVRRELHRKLGVQHRGELVRVAAQHGFVRFTGSGVIRPGFGIMCAAYHARRAKREESRTATP